MTEDDLKDLPIGYLRKKLLLVMPLFQEARDALPAISIASMKLRGICPNLDDRMDYAGTYSLADWEKGQRNEPAGSLRAALAADDLRQMAKNLREAIGFVHAGSVMYSVASTLDRAALSAASPIPDGEVVIGDKAGNMAGWHIIKWREDLPPLVPGTKVYLGK